MRALRHIAAFVSWHRRWIGALLAAGSVLLVAQALATPPPTVPVVVLAAPVAPGDVIDRGDIAIAHLSPDALPDGHLTSADDAVGLSAAVGAEKGTILQPSLFASQQMVEPGRAAVPIPVRDPQLRALLSPGTAITLVTAGGEFAEALTSDARIAALPPVPSGGGLSIGPSQAEGLVMVDVPVEQAPVVAALGQTGQLTIIFGGV